MLKALFDYVATGLALTKGTDWHYGHIPAEEADLCSGLLNRVGLPVDGDNLYTRWGRFQIYTRGPTYMTAEAEAKRIFEYVIALRGAQLNGWFLYDAVGNEPASIGKDDKGRHAFSANVTVSARKES